MSSCSGSMTIQKLFNNINVSCTRLLYNNLPLTVSKSLNLLKNFITYSALDFKRFGEDLFCSYLSSGNLEVVSVVIKCTIIPETQTTGVIRPRCIFLRKAMAWFTPLDDHTYSFRFLDLTSIRIYHFVPGITYFWQLIFLAF